jgi:hypothetical protein
MRAIAIAVCICSATLSWADNSVVFKPPVRLDSQADLAKLQAANPDHYARATRLIAAANVLCPPGRPRVQSTGLDSRHVACGHLFLTSNPPKREISFTLDGTPYAALVTVTADPPKPERVQQAHQPH